MSEEEKEEKNEKMISAGEESAENVKMEGIVKKKSSKEKDLDTMMFGSADVKNPNAVTLMKYHIDDTTTTSGSFTKEKSSEKNEDESSEKTKEKKTDE